MGTVFTIWGVFLLLRFPHDDLYALPVLETVYYAAGAWLEVPRVSGARRAPLTLRIRARAAALSAGSERSRPT